MRYHRRSALALYVRQYLVAFVSLVGYHGASLYPLQQGYGLGAIRGLTACKGKP